MKRATWLCVLAVLALGACDESPTAPGKVRIEPTGSVEEVTAFIPAVDDLDERVLSTGSDRVLMDQLSERLREVKVALKQRDAQAAEDAVTRARVLAAQCDNTCLIPQEKSVIQLTLEYAERLIGLDDQGR